MPIRWVFVRDRDGTHRDEYFYTTDPGSTVARSSRLTRADGTSRHVPGAPLHLGLETTRGWCRRTVLRARPCLFGLYSVVALLYRELPERSAGGVEWPGKSGRDLLGCVVLGPPLAVE